MSLFVLEDVLEVTGMDREGKFFERVSRIDGKTEGTAMDITLDINTEIYPVETNDKFSLVLTEKITEAEESPAYTKKFRLAEKASDNYDYVCFGTVYVVEERTVCISFGGLLMQLRSESKITGFTNGNKIYLMLKKIN
ncbi:MAG: DNA-directed RNA polymerases I, II, and III subunit RPABC3 [Amphiamblys sp. WSBS2006]|nr:MAG: DNA-directed RNA polymerases I, II, and III subunit RPABC3 [Amphiamblys sp. WSBS2006]